MKRNICALLVAVAAATTIVGGCKKETPPAAEAPQSTPAQPSVPAPPAAAAKTGEELFKEHCAVCHPDGGNVVKPEYTLRGPALARHGVTKPEDIVKNMRNPGAGMTKFDEATIPDKEAMAIAEYVLKTFK